MREVIQKNVNVESPIRQKIPRKKERIVGGYQYQQHEFPWLVYLLFNNTFICGGSVINDRYVLTAAHCVKEGSAKKLLKVVLGEHNRCSGKSKSYQLPVVSIKRHPHYNNATFEGDLMLLKVNLKIPFDFHVKPICLPLFSRKLNSISEYVGKNGVVLGWGKTRTESTEPTCKPLALKVPIIEQNKCKDSRTYSLFCAGYLEGKRDSCQGDSGGPLQMQSSNKKYHLIGIVSNGLGCAERSHPGLYTNVVRYLPWIYKNTADSSYCW